MTYLEFITSFPKKEIVETLGMLGKEMNHELHRMCCILFERKSKELDVKMHNNIEKSKDGSLLQLCECHDAWKRINNEQEKLFKRFSSLETRKN